MPPHKRLSAIDRARNAWGDTPPRVIAVLAAACDEKGQNQVADAVGLARSTVSELINRRRPVDGYGEKLASGLEDIGFAIVDPEPSRAVADLGVIDWQDKAGQPLRRGRVVFRASMCAGHWAVVAEGDDGRVPLILKTQNDGTHSAVVLRAEPDAGRHVAALNLLGRPLHRSVGEQVRMMAEATLFYSTGAGTYL